MSLHVCIASQVSEAVERLAKTQGELRESLQNDCTEQALEEALNTQTRILSLYKSGFKKDLTRLVG